MTPKPGPDPQLEEGDILRYISREYSPAVGTNHVADHFDVKQQTAHKYLSRMSEKGLIDSRKIGRVRIWWLTDKGRREISPG